MHHSLYPYLNSTMQISFHLLVAQYTPMPELDSFVIPCIGAHGYCSIFYRPATSSRRVQTEVLKCEKDMPQPQSLHPSTHPSAQKVNPCMLLCFLFYRLHIHRRGNITFLDISFQNSVFLGTNLNFFSWVVRWMAGGPNGTGLTPQKTSNFWRKNA